MSKIVGLDQWGFVSKDRVKVVNDYIADLERQRDELVRLVKRIHLTNDHQWLYGEYGEGEWIADRDELIAKAEKDDG